MKSLIVCIVKKLIAEEQLAEEQRLTEAKQLAEAKRLEEEEKLMEKKEKEEEDIAALASKEAVRQQFILLWRLRSLKMTHLSCYLCLPCFVSNSMI